MGSNTDSGGRIVSLDQFRGYTVLGMFLVNFLGSFAVIHPLLRHHHTYCSYADTIMPQFFFAAGFAYRLTFLKRWQEGGARLAYGRAARRCLGLLLVGILIHQLDGRFSSWSQLQELGLAGFFRTAFQRNVFQTLTHIAVTSLWVLPVLGAGPSVRVAFACLSGGLHLLIMHGPYYEWVLRRPGIDGGPLGFLTWTVPLLAGTLVYDWMAARRVHPPLVRLLAWGTVLMLLGYGLSCLNRVTPPNSSSAGAVTSYLVEPPFVPPSQPVNRWTMSQRAGSLSYQLFATGFALLLYTLFVLASDLGRFQSRVFATLGANALAAYILHELAMNAIKPFCPTDAPLWYALATFGVFFAVCWVILRYLEKNRLFLRL